MYQYILLDMDGTLTDSMEGVTRCVQYALEAAGRPEPDRQKLLAFIGPPLRTQFAAWCGYDREKEAEKIEFCVSKYRERFRDVGWLENRVYPGMPEMLAQLKEAGKTLCVATSKPIEFTEKILDYFGLTPYFDEIVGASLDEGRETKYDVICEALRRLAIGADKKPLAVMVGDRLHDIEAAKEAGLASIGVTFGYGSREELEQYGADRIVDTVEELGETLLAETTE